MTGDRCDQRTLAAAYGGATELYDEIWSPVILPPALSLISRLDLAGARRVLDIGAGTGSLTPILRQLAPAAHLISIEPSQSMLRVANGLGLSSCVLGDAAAVPVADGRVDVVVLAYVLFHLLDPDVGMREAGRVLRGGGHVGTVTWANEQPPRATAVWNEVMERYDVPTLPEHRNDQGLDSEGAIDTLIRRTGLEPVEVWTEPIDHTLEPDAFWRLRTGLGLSRARLDTLDNSTRAEVLAEAHRCLGALRPSDHRFRGEVVCSVSRRRG
jgi:SAM-dependent methyltransferase